MLSVVEVTLQQGIDLLESIKDIRPYTVAGGVFTVLAPQDVIENEYVDAVCIGEGETAIIEFCSKYASGSIFSDVPGMWFKQDSQIIKNPIKRLVGLNKAPFLDFSLYEKERFFKFVEEDGLLFREAWILHKQSNH